MNTNDRDERDEITFDELIIALKNEVTLDELKTLKVIVDSPELQNWRKVYLKENANDEVQIWNALVSHIAYDLEDGVNRFFFDFDRHLELQCMFKQYWNCTTNTLQSFPEAQPVVEFFLTWLKTHSL